MMLSCRRPHLTPVARMISTDHSAWSNYTTKSSWVGESFPRPFLPLFPHIFCLPLLISSPFPCSPFPFFHYMHFSLSNWVLQLSMACGCSPSPRSESITNDFVYSAHKSEYFGHLLSDQWRLSGPLGLCP